MVGLSGRCAGQHSPTTVVGSGERKCSVRKVFSRIGSACLGKPQVPTLEIPASFLYIISAGVSWNKNAESLLTYSRGGPGLFGSVGANGEGPGPPGMLELVSSPSRIEQKKRGQIPSSEVAFFDHVARHIREPSDTTRIFGR